MVRLVTTFVSAFLAAAAVGAAAQQDVASEGVAAQQGVSAVGVADTDSVSAVERQIVEEVDARSEAAIALLERTVDIDSGTMNFDGVRHVGQVFRGELNALGFATEWVDGTPFHRAGHLVARCRRRAHAYDVTA